MVQIHPLQFQCCKSFNVEYYIKKNSLKKTKLKIMLNISEFKRRKEDIDMKIDIMKDIE